MCRACFNLIFVALGVAFSSSFKEQSHSPAPGVAPHEQWLDNI